MKIRRMVLKPEKTDPEWLQKHRGKKQEKFERRQVQIQKEKSSRLQPSLGDVWPDES